MKINIHKEKKSSLIILLMTVYLGMLLSCSTSLAVSDPNKQIIPDSNSKPVSEEKNAKYWAERVQKVRGNELMTLLRSVPSIRDPNLLQSILDYAIEDNYSTMYLEGLPGGPASPRYHSTFDEAAGLLYSITKGKIGLERVSRQGPMPEEKKEDLIMKWRQELPRIQEEFRTEIRERQKEIKPIAHKELLEILKEAESSKDKSVYAKKFKTYNLNDKLETIAYVLVEGIYTESVFGMIHEDDELHDKRLIPIISQIIKGGKEDKLLTAVWMAREIPDKSLLPILMDYTIDSNYVKIKKSGTDEHIEYDSVFIATAEAIYRITNKTIGTNNYSSIKIVPDEERSNMIKKWRKIYDETLKKDYEKK